MSTVEPQRQHQKRYSIRQSVMGSGGDFGSSQYYQHETAYPSHNGVPRHGTGPGYGLEAQVGALDMSRTDSGYYSNNSITNSQVPREYQDSLLPLVRADGHQEPRLYHRHDMHQPQHTLDGGATSTQQAQQQQLDQLLRHAGSQMAGQYPDRMTPRTTNLASDESFDLVHDLDHDMGLDLDLYTDLLVRDEEASMGWANDDDVSMYAYSQEPIHGGCASARSELDDSLTNHSYEPEYHFPTGTAPDLGSGVHTADRKGRRQSQPGPDALTHEQLQVAKTTSTPISRFPCLHADCTKQFNRAADLDRHQKMVHCKDKAKAMLCDYRNCARHRNPFHRSDHFRDHLRDSHREDLLKRGLGAEGDMRSWWKARVPAAVYGGWWRCNKCFTRVSTEEHDFCCPGCGHSCEPERQAMRNLPLTCDYPECRARADASTFRSQGKFREHLRTIHLEDVPKGEGKSGLADLQSEAWWESRNNGCAYSTSWRCTRCLGWVDGEKHGWECSRCGFGCEEVRRAYRREAFCV